MEISPTKSDEKSEFDETSLNSRHRRNGGGFWNEWRTVENEQMEKVSDDDDGEEKGHRHSSAFSAPSAESDIVTHLPSVEQNNGEGQCNQLQITFSSLPNCEFIDGATTSLPADLSDDFRPDICQIASSSPSALSSDGISSSPKSSSSTPPGESNGQIPSSNLSSSSFSAEVSVLALSRNKQRNVRFFIDAIDQSKLATPTALEDKLKVLDWLGNLAEENGQGREEKSPSPSMSASCSDFPESQERLQNLQVTRESLSLQVASLSRQVALQREKIRDLEESLGRGMNGKQYMQGQQQKQIGEQLAELRNNYLALEREKADAEKTLQNEAERFSQHPAEQKDIKVDELQKLQMAVQRLMADNEQKNSLIKMLHNALEEQQRRILTATLLQQQKEVSSHQMDINEQIRRILLTDDLSLDGSDHSMAHSSSFPAGLCAHSFRSASPRRSPLPLPSSVPTSARQQCFPVSTSFSSSLSHLQLTTAMVPPPPLWRVSSPSPPSVPPHRLVSDNHSNVQPPQLLQLEQPSTSSSGRAPTSPLARQLAAELDELRQSGVGVLLRQPYSSASLPRSIHSKANSLGVCATTRLRHGKCSLPAKEDGKSKRGERVDIGTQKKEGISNANGIPFSDWVRRMFGSTSKAPQKERAHSTPNLAHSRKVSREETVESDDELLFAASSARGSVPNSAMNGHSSANAKHLKRGRRARSTLRSFLGRFAHRGNSLQDVRPTQRLSPSLLPIDAPSSSCLSVRPSLCHFVDWDRAHCSRWLTEVGFGDAFVGAVRSGRHLLSMAETELETELGIRSALQRKRLKCMLDRIERNTETEAADKMDTNLTMLWLDQIGLPQLRDTFAENRIDGHLLLLLSVQDLIELGVHSALNHASLARAIQFLRSVDFHLHRLEQHFSSELLSRCPIPAEVERWSHCCAVEWLRSEDLEEFTPNLAFSGFHGALMVYEPTFTAESLAEMLQIPPTKSLIRRHLTTQFNALLGQHIVGNKRDTVAQPMVTHLTPGLKIRLTKKGFSLGRKKSKSDIFVEPEVRVCPAEERMTMNGTERGEMSEV